MNVKQLLDEMWCFSIGEQISQSMHEFLSEKILRKPLDDLQLSPIAVRH